MMILIILVSLCLVLGCPQFFQAALIIGYESQKTFFVPMNFLN